MTIPPSEGGSNHLPHMRPGQRVAMGGSNYQLLGASKVMGGGQPSSLPEAPTCTGVQGGVGYKGSRV
eukprot:3546572-Prymnesium_polylepis.1